MYITTKTVVSFDMIKDEAAHEKFLETRDSDWIESNVTGPWITYTKEQTIYQDGSVFDNGKKSDK